MCQSIGVHRCLDTPVFGRVVPTHVLIPQVSTDMCKPRNLPLMFKMHEICSVDSQKNYESCCHRVSDFRAKMHQM